MLHREGKTKIRKTPQSYNSTLKMGSCELKRSPIKRVSAKQAAKNRELNKLEAPMDLRCEICNEMPDWRGLSRHHIKKRSQGGDNNKENILWLCGKCHSKQHGIEEIG